MSMTMQDLIRQKRQQMEEESGRRQKTVKAEKGRSRWRILPSWRGQNQPFWHDFGLHFIKSPHPDSEGNNLKAVYLCVKRTYDRPCEICELIKRGKLAATTDEQLHALNESESRTSILVNAVRVDGPEPNVVKILELRPSVFTDVLAAYEIYSDPIDPQSGRDLYITRTGSGLNTKYSTAFADPSPIDPALLTQLNNLDEYVAQEDEQMKRKAIAATATTAGMLPAPSGQQANVVATQQPAAAVNQQPVYQQPAQQQVYQHPAAQPAAQQPVAEQEMPFEPDPQPAAQVAQVAEPIPEADVAASEDDEIDSLLATLNI